MAKQLDIFLKQGESRTLYAGEEEAVVLVQQGKGNCNWTGHEQTFCAETVLLLRPQTQMTVTAKAKTQLWKLKLSRQLLEYLSDEECNLAGGFSVVPFCCAAVQLPAQDATMLKRLAALLWQEQHTPNQFAASISEKSLLALFVVLLLRACRKEEKTNALVNRRRLIVDEVFAYIGHHITQPLTLEYLSAQFYVSPEHLSREFKRQTGQTVHRYIVKIRLARCKELLCDGLPLTAIWQQCGFSSYTSMIRSFQKEFGITPAAYYKQCCQLARNYDATRTKKSEISAE